MFDERAAMHAPLTPGSTGRAWTRAFWLVWGLSLGLRSLAAAALPLSGDEAYFWEWSRHLAAGYYDHPGLVAYAIAATAPLGGAASELAVRLPAVLALAATAVIVRGLARGIAAGAGLDVDAAGRAAALAGLAVLLVPVHAFFGVFVSGDALVLLCWAGAAALGLGAVARGGTARWLATGVVAGLGLQAKFLFLPFVLAFGLFLVAAPRGRRALARPQPWLALAACLALQGPFLAWNADHEWATFRFNFALRHDHIAPPLAWLQLVGLQLAVLTPAFAVLAVAAVVALARGAAGRRATEGELLLAALLVVPLALFAGVSLRGIPVGAHWPAGAALAACALVPLHLERMRLSGAIRRARGWTAAVLGPCALLTGGALLAALLPARVLARIDAGAAAELAGWDVLARRVADVLSRIGAAGERDVFLLATQYGFAAQLAFYTPGQPPVSLWEDPRRHGQSYREWERYEALAGDDALFVTKKESRLAGAIEELEEHFERVHEPERVPVVAGERELRSFWLVRCEGFDGRAPSFERGP